MPYDDDDAGALLESLHDAILEALLNGGMLSEETLERCSARTGVRPTTPSSDSTR